MAFALHVEERTMFKRVDWNLILVILSLNFVGLVNLYSATHGPHSADVEPLFLNQIVWISAGWACFFIATLLDYAFISRIAYIIYFLNLGAILWVTFYGKVALGAQRWIDLGFFHYQPSETMKICLIMVLAKVLATRNSSGDGMGFRALLWPVILMGIPFVLVVEQPDLGTAMMLAAIGSTMIIFCKVKKFILTGIAISVAVAMPIAWKYALRDYQRARITNFISPANDPRGSGYNSIFTRTAHRLYLFSLR
jgi:rod shape determining protein RodA